MIARIPVRDVEPVVDCGARPAKAVVGEMIPVTATVFREGHDLAGANVVLRDPDGAPYGDSTRMRLVAAGTDRWAATITCPDVGAWSFVIESWSDPFGSWRHDAEIKIVAGQDVERVLETGARLLERAVDGAPKPDRADLLSAIAAIRDTDYSPSQRLAAALDPDVLDVLDRSPVRDLVGESPAYPLWVERERALYGAWYELFPRSEGARYDARRGRWRSGTLRTAARRLPAIAAMGFDVVYLAPIHPIGTSYRKGANNTLDAGPDDPGSPWAIGSADGGHDAIHPDLGTLADFDAFVARASKLGLEVALDLALQCSPDHPWVREHPEWFAHRVDGSIAYAENPPKKYQDIYPLNFDADPEGLAKEVLRVVRHWMAHGVRIFRVDNPHTKPVAFWEWLIAEVRATDPDVVWLSEAFTRPPMLQTLGRVGFTQSYTYFTWRTEKVELEAYANELAQESSAYLRPNFFVNTPDILHAFLQYGGPPAFRIRAVLAALLSPSWGVYSGFELCEHVAVRPGSEEYLDAEKYSYRPRDWRKAEAEGTTIAPYLTRLNEIRRAHPALHQLRNLALHNADQPQIMCWSKWLAASRDRPADVVIVVVNLDPHAAREATVHLDLAALGFAEPGGRAPADAKFEVADEMTGQRFVWAAHNYVRLDPAVQPAHVLTMPEPAG